MVHKAILNLGLIITLILSFSITYSTSAQYGDKELMEISSTCLDCHDEYEATLAGTAHRVIDDTELHSPVSVGCISCHDGWQTHIDDPSEENISDPSNFTLLDQAETCKSCHLTPHQAIMTSSDPHYGADIGCLDCHNIHESADGNVRHGNPPVDCGQCHTSVISEFKSRSAHPYQSGNIECLSCHNFSGVKGAGQTAGLDWSCQECHSEYSGPYLHEHPVAYSHLVEGGGCPECHEPHGSPNERLLKQPGNSLCFQCHGTPPGHRTNHSGLGTKLACVECHSDIHGSFDNSKMLDPFLGIRLFPDCFQSGCHIFDN